MTVALFFIIFGACSIATGLITEAIKKLIYHKTPNLVALFTGLIIGCAGTTVYYIFNRIPFTLTNIIAMVLMGISVAIGAMIGYDKVVQGIHQILSKNKEA